MMRISLNVSNGDTITILVIMTTRETIASTNLHTQSWDKESARIDNSVWIDRTVVHYSDIRKISSEF